MKERKMKMWYEITKNNGFIDSYEKPINIPKHLKRYDKNGIDWIEEGYSADLSTVACYSYNKESKMLTRIDGGKWNFIPAKIYVRDTIIDSIRDILKLKER